MRFKDGRICTDYMGKLSCQQSLWSGNEHTDWGKGGHLRAPYTLLT